MSRYAIPQHFIDAHGGPDATERFLAAKAEELASDSEKAALVTASDANPSWSAYELTRYANTELEMPIGETTVSWILIAAGR